MAPASAAARRLLPLPLLHLSFGSYIEMPPLFAAEHGEQNPYGDPDSYRQERQYSVKQVVDAPTFDKHSLVIGTTFNPVVLAAHELLDPFLQSFPTF